MIPRATQAWNATCARSPPRAGAHSSCLTLTTRPPTVGTRSGQTIPAPSSRAWSRRWRPTPIQTPVTTRGLLRVHLGLVCEALDAAGHWPVALPALLRVAQRARFGRLATLAAASTPTTTCSNASPITSSALQERSTQGQLDGSLRALEVVAGQAWRRVLTPSERGAVTLPAAMAAGAIVLWKTHVEDIKEEAETITTLALADIGAAARTLPDDAQWVLLLDEFGSVLQGRAGARAVALMQRARSSHGQVLVSTQSISDVPSATGNEHLLGALTDNFTAFIAHRQTSPESRDWLAKLFGTREIWQSTDRTMTGRLDGAGSRRRAAEFIVRPDEFRQLKPGEAIIATTLGPPPEQVTVTPGPVLEHEHVPDARTLYRTIPAHGTVALTSPDDEGKTNEQTPEEPSATPRRRQLAATSSRPRTRRKRTSTVRSGISVTRPYRTAAERADTLRCSQESGPAALARPGPWHRRTSLPCTRTVTRRAPRLRSAAQPPIAAPPTRTLKSRCLAGAPCRLKGVDARASPTPPRNRRGRPPKRLPHRFVCVRARRQARVLPLVRGRLSRGVGAARAAAGAPRRTAASGPSRPVRRHGARDARTAARAHRRAKRPPRTPTQRARPLRARGLPGANCANSASVS